MRSYYKVGLSFAILHAALFSLLYILVSLSEESQAQLSLLIFWVIDFPVSMLADYNIWTWMPQIISPPIFLFGILGSIWWYFVPKFLLPKRLGGIWGLSPSGADRGGGDERRSGGQQ
jgi:hypothetical protein